MKKFLIILSVFATIIACKSNAQKVVGTNEKGEKLVIAENGDTIVLEDADSLNVAELNPNEAALVKNEDETYTFRYNLKKGETYPFLLKTSQNQSMSVMGKSMNMKSERTVTFDYFVEEVTNNVFKLKATFKEFSESFTAPTGEKIAYNTTSAKPTDDTAGQSWKIYKAIIGESFQMEVDNKGKVHSVKGLTNVINNVQGKLKSDFTAEEQKMIKELLTAALNDKAIKSQFEETLNIFPDKNLKVGEEWVDSQNISEGPVKGTNKVTRTFKEINNNVAKITVAGSQNVSGSETQQGISATMKSNSTLDGFIELDLASGWIKKVSLTKKDNLSTTYQQGDKKETESGTSTTITTVN
jgi:hypothetical protein